jgi:hypothetical protein
VQYKNLNIVYIDKNQQEFSLDFKLRNYPIVDRWANKLLIANKKYKIDDPDRFGGFGSFKDQAQIAIEKINANIEIINQFKTIVDRKLTTVEDQDTLNYLHHIFEVYHGLLDQQTHEYWKSAPPEVRRAIANINTLVHQCEGINENCHRPHHFVTWYSLPKIDMLFDNEYELFEDDIKEGTVYLLYTEIGKTLEDLAIDNDTYIFDEAFKPFRHYSADFVVNFWDSDPEQLIQERVKIKEYYDKHKDFFLDRGLGWGHPYLTNGLLPLADLVNAPENYLEILHTHQYVKSVNIT